MNFLSKEFILETVKFLILAVVVVLPIRLFIAQPFVVSGSSMYPTFETGEYLIVDQLSYRMGDPQRGDVIIFRYPNDTSKFFIKRIIGLPSETLELKEDKITIFNDKNPNGLTLDEPYIVYQKDNEMTVKLESDEYFVMGDNRIASSDSRIWGPLKKEYIIGRAYVRLLPFTKINYLPGSVEIK